ncbi:unnamed protein product [Mytilus coruscus]|uniref:Endonuclease/exonuclease/phosphatase domain-containing protein n=1 Tax=Mytilus coruscus TaxID=42192 RepID=A0A6J8A4W7_MYTCO|nr:unnamed protein product [Mytilus coruscus]
MPGQSTKRKNASLLSDSESKKPSKTKTKKKNKHSNVNTGENYSENLPSGSDRVPSNVNIPANGPSFPLSQQYFCSSSAPGMYPKPRMQHVSPFTQPQISQQRPPWVDELFKRMDKFQEKLNKIDQIESLVTTINAKVIRLEQGAISLDNRMEQVVRCSQLISDNYDKQKGDLTELKTEVNNISKSLRTNSNKVKNVGHEFRSSLSDMEKENDKLKESILDVQMKSMSKNLIFYNIHETEVENCPDVILNFCKDTMKLENSDQIHLSDAHGIGKKVNSYDVLFLCETWLQKDILINIEGFTVVTYVNRKKNIVQREEGGIAVFCKNNIFEGIAIEKEYDHGIVLIKFSKLYFNLNDDLYICFAYIPHEKSNFYRICDNDFHDDIENIFLEYKYKGTVIVCGDMNSRTGELNDFLETDNLEKYIGSVEPDVSPTISKRCSMDKVINAYGRKLIQLCYNTGLTIANGRLGNDSCGTYTFCTSRGQSVNDHLLVCPENYDIIKNFGVLDFTEFSDHAPLSYEISLNTNIQCNSLPSTHKYLKWDSSKKQDYIQLLSQHNELLISLVRNMTCANDVNNAEREINRILYDSAFFFFFFGKTILKRSSTYVKRHDNDWFNQNCVSARRDFNSVRNFYQRHPTDANRQHYISARNRYNRT